MDHLRHGLRFPRPASFEVHAVDYLLKPFDENRFAEAIHRVRENRDLHRMAELQERLFSMVDDWRQGEPAGAPRSPSPAPLPHEPATVRVSHRGLEMELPLADIAWGEASGNYLGLHMGKEQFLVRGTVRSFADHPGFLRIHPFPPGQFGTCRRYRQ